MGAEDRDTALPAEDGLSTFLDHAESAARAGHDPGTALPAGTARLFGLDALTLNMLAHGGHLELLWCDPAEGLGPELDDLQYTLGDGPTLEAARHGHTVAVPDLSAADPARWPLFLPTSAHTPARAVIAAPLRLGADTIGALTGYRTSLGLLTPAQLGALHRLGRILLHLLHTELITPADDADTVTTVRLYRAEIHQATGFLACELGIPTGQALLRLRAHAATHDEALIEIARRLLARRLPPDSLDPTG
ncbi:GAF and ANTAR domain-containing protein [Streptomyces sp. NPDC001661]